MVSASLACHVYIEAFILHLCALDGMLGSATYAAGLRGGKCSAFGFSARAPIRLRPVDLRRLDQGLIWRVVRIALSSIGETIVSRLDCMLSTRILATLGTAAVAAHQIALRVESLAYMSGWGMAIATAALVGQALGAEKQDVAERGIQRTPTISTMVGTFFFRVPLAYLTAVVFAGGLSGKGAIPRA